MCEVCEVDLKYEKVQTAGWVCGRAGGCSAGLWVVRWFQVLYQAEVLDRGNVA